MSRSELAPSRHSVELGFWQCVDDVECPQEAKLAALERLDLAILEGDPVLEVAAIQETIGSTDWSWSWFDEWAATFNGQQSWPYNWQQLRLTSFSTSREAIQKENHRICNLLAITILQRVYMVNRLLQRSETHGRIEFSSAGCPVEDQITQAITVESHGLPPYFPGDRTRIRFRRTTH